MAKKDKDSNSGERQREETNKNKYREKIERICHLLMINITVMCEFLTEE